MGNLKWRNEDSKLWDPVTTNETPKSIKNYWLRNMTVLSIGISTCCQKKHNYLWLQFYCISLITVKSLIKFGLKLCWSHINCSALRWTSKALRLFKAIQIQYSWTLFSIWLHADHRTNIFVFAIYSPVDFVQTFRQP